MNKDSRGLSQVERQMLVITDHQLLQEMKARTQMYFKPSKEFEKRMETNGWLFNCIKCQQIPLDLKVCICCEAIICTACKFQILEEALSGRNTIKGCPTCKDNPELHLVPLKNKTIKQKLNEMTEAHSCTGKLQKMNHQQLHHHAVSECGHNRRCQPCLKDFNSMEELRNHVQYCCPAVEISCHECGSTFTRKEFVKHACYTQHDYAKKELLEALQKAPPGAEQEFINRSIRKENQKLLEENM